MNVLLSSDVEHQKQFSLCHSGTNNTALKCDGRKAVFFLFILYAVLYLCKILTRTEGSFESRKSPKMMTKLWCVKCEGAEEGDSFLSVVVAVIKQIIRSQFPNHLLITQLKN